MLQSTQERFLLVPLSPIRVDVQIGNPKKDLNEEYQITPNQTQVGCHIYIGNGKVLLAIKIL